EPKGHNGTASTTHLRDTDLEAARLHLKTDRLITLPLPQVQRMPPLHERPLPFFMMRHRNMRIHTRVGHARTQGSIRRLGQGGPALLTARILIVLTLLGTLLFVGTVGGGIAGGIWYLNQLPPVDPVHLPG